MKIVVESEESFYFVAESEEDKKIIDKLNCKYFFTNGIGSGFPKDRDKDFILTFQLDKNAKGTY